jgi:hypothetical protein
MEGWLESARSRKHGRVIWRVRGRLDRRCRRRPRHASGSVMARVAACVLSRRIRICSGHAAARAIVSRRGHVLAPRGGSVRHADPQGQEDHKRGDESPDGGRVAHGARPELHGDSISRPARTMSSAAARSTSALVVGPADDSQSEPWPQGRNDLESEAGGRCSSSARLAALPVMQWPANRTRCSALIASSPEYLLTRARNPQAAPPPPASAATV